MKYYCNPLNLPYKYLFVKNHRNGDTKAVVYREAADPSLVLFKGSYLMFPSMTAGFFSSKDLSEWEFHEFKGDMPIYDYAPDVHVVGDYLYFSASKRYENCSFFRTKDPINKPFEEIKGTFPFWDPNLFQDDDGKLYLYWGCSNMTPIYGVELDLETMVPKTEPLIMFDWDNNVRGYERIGDDHIPPKTQEEIDAAAQAMIQELMSVPEEQRAAIGFGTEEEVKKLAYSVNGIDPYIEGAWMTKHDGKYYLQYAAPGTEYNIYADGVFVSDFPLGPYKLAKNNPYSYKPGGFMNGAGHGSTLKDIKGNYWHVSTESISINNGMERRVGLWKAGFDKDGELYCDQRFGDWPIALDAPAFTKPDYMLLSYGKTVSVSGGKGAENITDENARTWWSAEKGDSAQIDLGQIFDLHAVQVNFADDKILVDMPEGGVSSTYEDRYIDKSKKVTSWLLEGSLDGKKYFIISDKSNSNTDFPHDFILIETGLKARFIKLTVFNVPYGKPCISGLRVFGKGNGQAPDEVFDIQTKLVGDINMDITWKGNNATGYNVLWGYSPDKLYHSYMVFGSTGKRIGALIKGEPVYIRVDAFNEFGITEGKKVIKVK